MVRRWFKALGAASAWIKKVTTWQMYRREQIHENVVFHLFIRRTQGPILLKQLTRILALADAKQSFPLPFPLALSINGLRLHFSLLCKLLFHQLAKQHGKEKTTRYTPGNSKYIEKTGNHAILGSGGTAGDYSRRIPRSHSGRGVL